MKFQTSWAFPSTAPLGTQLGKPSCSNCGYDLTNATSSANCPECGKPLVEVLVREGAFPFRKATRRFESSQQLFGMPLVSIAFGPDATGRMGRAKGYFAFGDIATGVFAFGGFARGLVAFGGMSIGGVTFGGLSLGTFAAFGGGAVAILGSAVGGFAAGLMAHGGGAIGVFAQGGLAIGYLARGGSAKGVHTWPARATPDAATQALFDQYAWLIGPSGPVPPLHYGLAWTAGIALIIAILALLPASFARERRDPRAEELLRPAGVRGVPEERQGEKPGENHGERQ